jgi:hypothetical protein
MTERTVDHLSTFRLYLLRAMYLLMAVGLALDIWPLMITASQHVEHMRGVVWSLLSGLSLMALLGVRYPVRMLPLLLFELTWKTIWVGVIGIPLWLEHRLSAGTAGSLRDCLVGVVLCVLVIPWKYVLVNFAKAPGDPWRRARRGTPALPMGEAV